MPKTIKKILNNEEGLSAVEYAILAALIAGAVIVSIGLLGIKVENLFDQVNTLFTG